MAVFAGEPQGTGCRGVSAKARRPEPSAGKVRREPALQCRHPTHLLSSVGVAPRLCDGG